MVEKPVYQIFDYDPNEDPYGDTYIAFLKKKFGVSDAPKEPLEPFPLVTRAEWGALPPKDPNMKPMHKPIQVAYFLQTESEECHTREECVKFLLDRQKNDMEEKELADIQYNFYISSDGTVYEGRGWEIESDKDGDDEPLKNKSVDIAYIGDYEDKELSRELIQKGCDLIIWARKVPDLVHDHINITTFWEDHIDILAVKSRKWNPMDIPGLREIEYKQDFPLPPENMPY